MGSPKLIHYIRAQCQADQAAAIGGHEVDRLRRDQLGSHAEVAFIFPVFVIDQDDHLPGLDIFDYFLY